MTCQHCLSTSIFKRQHRTSLGYRTFSCRACRRRFNERSATPFQRPPVPNRCRPPRRPLVSAYKLGFRDVADLLL